jgi:hypothetical protein
MQEATFGVAASLGSHNRTKMPLKIDQIGDGELVRT